MENEITYPRHSMRMDVNNEERAKKLFNPRFTIFFSNIKFLITEKIIFIFIFSIMPQKLNMVISNPPIIHRQFINTASLGASPISSLSMATPKAHSALNAPFIARIHNVKPGCGSCGRH